MRHGQARRPLACRLATVGSGHAGAAGGARGGGAERLRCSRSRTRRRPTRSAGRSICSSASRPDARGAGRGPGAACAAAGRQVRGHRGRRRVADPRTGRAPPSCGCRRSRPGGSSSTARTPATGCRPGRPDRDRCRPRVRLGRARDHPVLPAAPSTAWPGGAGSERVLDLGCGSGVLAIAAAKCWPARVAGGGQRPDRGPGRARQARAQRRRPRHARAVARPTATATRRSGARRRST